MPTLTVEISDFMLERLQESNNALVITLSNGDSEGGYGWFVRGMAELVEEVPLHSGPRTPYTRRFEVTHRAYNNFGCVSTLTKGPLDLSCGINVLKTPYAVCGGCTQYDHGECLSKRRHEVDEFTRAGSCPYYREVEQ